MSENKRVKIGEGQTFQYDNIAFHVAANFMSQMQAMAEEPILYMDGLINHVSEYSLCLSVTADYVMQILPCVPKSFVWEMVAQKFPELRVSYEPA